MRTKTRIAAAIALIGASSLAFAEPAFAASSIYDSQSVGLPGGSSAFNVTADAGPIKISGHIIKISALSCDASSSDRSGNPVKNTGYLDTTLTAYGAKLDSATASASFDGLGGSVTGSTTKVTFHGPRQKWSSTVGKRYSKLNITIDGGNAATWTYVRLTCNGTVQKSAGDVTVEAGGRS